jgi:hypothetical protein
MTVGDHGHPLGQAPPLRTLQHGDQAGGRHDGYRAAATPGVEGALWRAERRLL